MPRLRRLELVPAFGTVAMHTKKVRPMARKVFNASSSLAYLEVLESRFIRSGTAHQPGDRDKPWGDLEP